jgi:hypothetical protein
MATDSRIEALGLWESGELLAVAAFRLAMSPLPVCRNDLLAVSNAHVRAGYGLELKRAVIAAARAGSARAVDSIVDQRNTAMLNLNRKLGGVVDIIDPEDPDYCICVIPL